MGVITNQLQIDANQAITAIDTVTASFTKYNGGLGTVINQHGTFNRSAKNAVMSMLQIDSAGNRITTTFKKFGLSYRAMSVTIAKETEAQKKAAANEAARLTNQAAASLARQKSQALAALAQTQRDNDNQTKEAYRQGAAMGKALKEAEKYAASQVKMAAAQAKAKQAQVIPDQFAASFQKGPTGTSPTLIAANVRAYTQITEGQARAVAGARGFSVAQTDAFLKTIKDAGKVVSIIDSVKERFASLGNTVATFGKVAAFTLISTGVNRIQEGLAKGTKEAIQYSRQIGLIQTLAKDSTDTYEKWNTVIAKVADELAMPVGDIAKATYDALSNQVIKTTKDMNLIVVAGNLARNTNSQIGDSINVLSSIMNSYGPAAGSYQRVSDELFTSIDLGRVRMEELNGVMGRSAGIAQTAGVSLRELKAGLIVQTQAGLDSAESATLLNNVFSQLIKPNDALAAQFKKMGFNSGAAAVSTLTFAGVMRVLANEAKHSSDGIALFFPEIRGLRGAATFAGEGIAKFEDALQQLNNAQGANAVATEIMAKNLGQNLLDQLQRSQNYLTNEWGMSFLTTIAKVTNALGGIELIIKSLASPVAYAGIATGIGVGVVGILFAIKTSYEAVVAINAVAMAVGAADAAIIVLGKNLVAFTIKTAIVFAPAIAVVGAFALAIHGINIASKMATDAVIADFEKLAVGIKLANEEATSNAIANFLAMTARMTVAYGSMVSKQKSMIAESVSVASKAGSEIAMNLANNFQVIVQLAGKGVSKLEEMQKESADRSVRIRKDRTDLIMDFEQKQYERQIGFYENEEKLAEKVHKYVPDTRIQNQITDLKNARAELKRVFGSKANVSGVDQSIRNAQSTLEANKRNFQFNPPSYGPDKDPIKQIVKLTTARNDLLRQREAKFIDVGDLDGAKKALDEILSNLDKLDSHRDTQGRNQIKGLNAASRGEVQIYLDLTQKLDIKEQAKTVQLAKQIEIEKQGVKLLEDRLKLASKFAGKGAFDKDGKLLEKYKGDVNLAVEELTSMQKAAYDVSSTLKGITDPLLLIQYKMALEEMTKSFVDQKINLQERAALSVKDLALEKGRQEYQEILRGQNGLITDLTKNVNDLGLGIDTNTNKAKEGLAVLLEQTRTLMGSASAFSRLVNIGTFQDRGRVDPTLLVETMAPLIETLSMKDKSKFDQSKAFRQLDVVMEYVTSAGGKHLEITDPENNKETTNFIAYLYEIKRIITQLGEPTKEYNIQRKKLQEALTAIAKTEVDMGAALKASNPGLELVVGKSDKIISQKDGIDKTAISWTKLAESIGKVNTITRELNTIKIPQPSNKKSGSWWNWADEGEVEGLASGGFAGSRGGFLASFLAGKFAKGTDLIPAMLTKGEFVVRAPMAERYYSQLVAINAGRAPIYRAQGGPVSNTSVGDIHVTIPGGTGPSVRDFANQVRRGVRAGTLRIT